MPERFACLIPDAAAEHLGALRGTASSPFSRSLSWGIVRVEQLKSLPPEERWYCRGDLKTSLQHDAVKSVKAFDATASVGDMTDAIRVI